MSKTGRGRCKGIVELEEGARQQKGVGQAGKGALKAGVGEG